MICTTHSFLTKCHHHTQPTQRRDALREIEAEVRQWWDEEKLYDAEVDPSKEHFLATFPYPYMNGPLHLGHAFTVTKADFATAYQRLQGKNVLFPFAFHCTGMPIQAAANKLKREIQTFGNPPNFAVDDDEDDGADVAGAGDAAAAAPGAPKELGKFKSRKSKTAKKSGGETRQWDILAKSDVDPSTIARFQDPEHWLSYFPPLGERDLRLFGLHCDWRRSFITTSANPFYDRFIQWQFYLLKEQGKIEFGKRPTIFSPLDGQACMDHDRASGENKGPQEYTLIKLEVQTPMPEANAGNRRLFLVAATLRPETMYGQTNCFVLPDGEYGVFAVDDATAFVCSDRSARNMSYQSIFAGKADGEYTKLATLKGSDLLGKPLRAPLAKYETVYTLPLLTISMDKGTGVVTSVPSDAPDDYAALRDLQEKDKLREKYNITAEMVDFAVVPIIDIPGMGNQSAVTLCEREGVKSQNDKEKLAKIKEEVYTAGFYKGVMLVGEEHGVKGMKVFEAKPVVRQAMIDAGLAVPYFEPEAKVMSRSGDECVVAFLDQWYLKYGDEDWKALVLKHIGSPDSPSDTFSAYTPVALQVFSDVIAWLKEWACSRSFGLGTKVPWDEQFVIESLSDSTIYMAYYTIAHLLQGRPDGSYTGPADGQPGPLGIRAEQMTPPVFDYIFRKGAYPGDCGIPEEKLAVMRESFEYWYPMNLRVSGKDLIYNHLTMSLYNHAAIWHDRPEMWPRSFFTNGAIQNSPFSSTLALPCMHACMHAFPHLVVIVPEAF